MRILFLDGEDLVFGFVANSSNQGKKSLDMSVFGLQIEPDTLLSNRLSVDQSCSHVTVGAFE